MAYLNIYAISSEIVGGGGGLFLILGAKYLKWFCIGTSVIQSVGHVLSVWYH